MVLKNWARFVYVRHSMCMLCMMQIICGNNSSKVIDGLNTLLQSEFLDIMRMTLTYDFDIIVICSILQFWKYLVKMALGNYWNYQVHLKYSHDNSLNTLGFFFLLSTTAQFKFSIVAAMSYCFNLKVVKDCMLKLKEDHVFNVPYRSYQSIDVEEATSN